MKGRITLAILICFTTFSSEAQTSYKFMEAVQEYQKNVRFRYNRQLEKDTIDIATFNLNSYLNLFDKLEFNPNREFDYIYFDNFLDGNPYIYAKEKSFDLKKHLSEKVIEQQITQDTKEQFIQKELYTFLNDSINRAYNHVIPEDSENGYLQFLFFYELGENFALKWHAYVKNKYILTTEKEIKATVKEYKRHKFYYTKKKDLKKLLKIDSSPIIELNSESCVITWLEKTHYGVFERTYQISRSFPYQIKLINENLLVEFNSTL